MIVLKELIFTGIFLFSRVPIWFIIYVAALKAHVSLKDAIVIIALLTMCKSFVNSELYNEPMSRYYTTHTLRTIMYTALFIVAYVGMFYYVLFATEIVKLMIIGFAFLSVLLFYNTKDDNSKKAYQSYNTPLGTRIVTTACWIYMLLVADSTLGYMSVVVAIVILELFQYYNFKQQSDSD